MLASAGDTPGTHNGGNAFGKTTTTGLQRRTHHAPSTNVQPVHSANMLTAEQQELISRLITTQQMYAEPSDDAISKLSVSVHKRKAFEFVQAFSTVPANEQHKIPGIEAPTPFQHLVELTILNVQLIVELTKSLPGFNTLCVDDQLSLQKVS
jgi:ecdysone receptor